LSVIMEARLLAAATDILLLAACAVVLAALWSSGNEFQVTLAVL
jgi:hypothetical protein